MKRTYPKIIKCSTKASVFRFFCGFKMETKMFFIVLKIWNLALERFGKVLKMLFLEFV